MKLGVCAGSPSWAGGCRRDADRPLERGQVNRGRMLRSVLDILQHIPRKLYVINRLCIWGRDYFILIRPNCMTAV